jgi:hypothetical protein
LTFLISASSPLSCMPSWEPISTPLSTSFSTANVKLSFQLWSSW